MIPEANANTDERQTIEQGQPPPAPPPDTIEAHREAPPPTTPPPTPPRGRLAASVQRMPPGGRWALGIALTFVAGFAWLLPMSHVSFVVVGALVLAAGVVFSTWWAVPLLAAVLTIGGWVASWVANQISPSPEGGEVFGFFIVLGVIPGLAFLLIATAFGRQRGISSVIQERVDAAPTSQWLPAISLVAGGGFLAGVFTILFGLGGGGGGLSIFFAVLVLLATTCLAVGIRLHSWLGLIVASVVYVAVAVLSEMLLWGPAHVSATILAFVSYIVVPAVVFSAIGTIIGQRRQLGQGQSQQRAIAGVFASPWIPAIGLAVVSGYFAGLLGFGGLQDFVLPNGLVLLSPMLISLACLLSSWLLRSWWGLIAVPAAYVAFAALTNGYFMTGQLGLDFGLFGIFIVLPAVVMSIIGTAIGMYTTSRGGPHPHYGQPATTA